MPNFTIQAPDGRQITIQANDQDTAIRGAQSWAAANPKAGTQGPAQPKGLAANFWAPLANVLPEVGRQVSAAEKQFGHDARVTYAPANADEQLTSAKERLTGALTGVPPTLGADALGVIGAPITGAYTALFGQPVANIANAVNDRYHVMPGKEADPQAIGALASMAVPMVGEASAVRGAAARLPTSTAQAFAPPSMASRVAKFDQAGVAPTLAAVGPNGSARVAKFAAENPFVGGKPTAALKSSIADTGRAASDLAAQFGDAGSRDATGATVQSGAQAFAQGTGANLPPDVARSLSSQRLTFGDKARALYTRVDRLVGDSSAPIPLKNTTKAVGDAMTQFDDPGLAATFKNGVINNIGANLLDANGHISWRDAQLLRTNIRTKLLADPALRGTISDAQVNSIYDGLTQDLANGAAQLGGPQAARAWGQANQFYRAGQARIQGALGSAFDAKSGEAAYDGVVNSAMDGGKADVQRLLTVKRSLKPDDWGDVAATALQRMGRPTPGAASVADGEEPFSVGSFVTNYNRMSPAGRDVLFGAKGGGGARAQALRAQLDNLAQVASMQKDVESAANHSNTGVIVQGGATVAGLANPHTFGPTVLSLAGVRGLGEVMTNPKFVRWLAGTARAPAEAMPARIDALRQIAKDEPAIAAALPGITSEIQRLQQAPQQTTQPQPEPVGP
jgi:hypothetical protein